MSNAKSVHCRLAIALLVIAWLCAPSGTVASTFTIPHSGLLSESEYGSVSWGAGTLVSRADVGGVSVDFEFTGLDGSGTGVKDDYEVEDIYGQTGGTHNADFSNFDGYTLVVENIDDQSVSVHLFVNTGFTGPSGTPSNDPTNDTFWAGPWVEVPAGDLVVLTLDFDDAEAWNISDNKVPHTGGGLGWTDGGDYSINTYDRGQFTSVGFEIADPTKGTNPNATIRLTPFTTSTPSVAPLPAGSSPINCTQSKTLGFFFTPDSGTPALKGYSVRVQAESELSFDNTDFTINTLPSGATVQYYLNQNASNDWTIDYAIMGSTSGITTAEELFSVEFHAASQGSGVVSIASATFRDLTNESFPVDYSGTATIVVDCSAPSGAMVINNDDTYTNSTSVILTSSVSDAESDMDEMRFSNDGGSTWPEGWVAYGTSHAWALTSGDGTKTVTGEYSDLAGNVFTTSDDITLDTSAPDAPTMDAEPTYTAGTSNTVSWSDESGSGAVAYYAECATDAGFSNVVGNSGWIGGQSHNFTGLNDGQTYHYRAKARDSALNESGWSNAVSSTQDNSIPSSNVLPLGTYQTTLTFNVYYSTSDGTSGVASVELFYNVDGGGYSSYGTFTSGPIAFTAGGDGTYGFYTVATDNAGNVEPPPASPPDASTVVDTTPPDVPDMTAEPAYTAGSSNTVSWSDESGSGAVSYYAECATDAGFASVVANSGWIPGLTHNFTGLTDGQIYYFHVRAKDDAGNECSDSSPVSSTQDDSDPTSSVDALPPYQGNVTFDVAYTANDATSGVASVELFYNFGGGGYSSYGTFSSSPISFTAASGDGVYGFYTVATDNVGNDEDAPLSPPDASTEVDTSTPSSPAMDSEPAYTAGTTNTVSWSSVAKAAPITYYAECATDAGFSNVVGNSGWIPGTSHEFTGLTDNQIYYYHVKAKDDANNEGAYSSSVSSTQDDSSPYGSMAIDAGATHTNTTSVTLNNSISDDASGLDEMRFKNEAGGVWSGWEPYGTTTIWTLDSGDGTKTVYAEFIDNVGNVFATSDDIVLDTGPPAAASTILASPGHKKVTVTWSDPGDSDLAQIEIWRALWHDGSLNSVYPEYDDDPGSTIPTRPASRAQADASSEWTQVGTANPGDESLEDIFASDDRGIYYYEVFAKDLAGNFSDPATGNGRATNYWLCDVDINTGPGGSDYDGDVDFDDVNVLSAAYWGCSPSSPPSWPQNECDLGPTDDHSGTGIPQTDDYVDFEDLMIYSLNYGEVSAKDPAYQPVHLAGPPESGRPVLRLTMLGSSEDGEETTAALSLGGHRDTVKGASVVLRYDPEVLDHSETALAPALVNAGQQVFVRTEEIQPGEIWLDLAVLGEGETLHNSGELARLSLRVKAEGDPGICFGAARVRDAANRNLSTEIENLVWNPGTFSPIETRIVGAWPNPFNPMTTIQYELRQPDQVSLRVYDPCGRLVAALVDGAREAGRHAVTWDGRDEHGSSVGSGVYMVRMQSGLHESVAKVVLLK
jgi:hypothetical protein